MYKIIYKKLLKVTFFLSSSMQLSGAEEVEKHATDDVHRTADFQKGKRQQYFSQKAKKRGFVRLSLSLLTVGAVALFFGKNHYMNQSKSIGKDEDGGKPINENEPIDEDEKKWRILRESKNSFPWQDDADCH